MGRPTVVTVASPRIFALLSVSFSLHEPYEAPVGGPLVRPPSARGLFRASLRSQLQTPCPHLHVRDGAFYFLGLPWRLSMHRGAHAK